MGQKRWHVILGFVFGLAAFTWIFSGMWSMSPIAVEPETVEIQVWRAMRQPVTRNDLFVFDHGSPQWALGRIMPQLHAHELELSKIGAEFGYFASPSSRKTAFLQLKGELSQFVGDNVIRDALNRAVKSYSVAESRVITSYETYYVDRQHEKPLPALYVRLNDPRGCFFYFDMRNGAIVESYGPAARWDRWLYNGLHLLDLPLLYRTRPIWDLLVIAFMLLALGEDSRFRPRKIACPPVKLGKTQSPIKICIRKHSVCTS